MPNIKSAIKRAKTSEKARQRNMKVKSRVKTLRKALLTSVAIPDDPKTPEAYRLFCSGLDKAAKHGIISKNTAIRKKNRAGAMVHKAAAK